MRFLRKLSIVVVTLGLLATAGPALASETDYTLAPGLRLHVINWHGSQVRVLSMNLKYGRRIRAVPAGPMLPALQYPSRLASDAGALAGVSSDFMMAGPSNQFGAFPAHMLVIGREIWTTGPHGAGWGYSQAGTNAYVGRNDYYIDIRDKHNLRLFGVARVNSHRPRRRQVVAWTARDRFRQHLPSIGCTAVLVPVSEWSWTKHRVAAERTYRVVQQDQPCAGHAPRGNQIVLNGRTHTVGGSLVKGLQPGQLVKWHQRLGHPGVTDVTGGWPQIVNQGRGVGAACDPDRDSCKPRGDAQGYVYGHLPRLAVGVSEDGHHSYLITIDQKAGWSDGASYRKLALIMLIRFHVWDLVGMDGGGSVVQWVRTAGKPPYCQTRKWAGCLVSRPAYGVERIHMYATVVV